MDSLPPSKRTFYGPLPGLDVAERPPIPNRQETPQRGLTSLAIGDRAGGAS